MTNEEPPDDLITTKHAAGILRVDMASVYRWVMKGKLRGWRRVGRIMVSKGDIQALIEPVRLKNGVKAEIPARPREAEHDAWADNVLREAGFKV